MSEQESKSDSTYQNIQILGRNVTIPTDWDTTTVDEACAKIIDYRGKNPEFTTKGVPHLRNINIEQGEIVQDNLKYVSEDTYEEWMTRGIPQKGDTLLSTEAPMGKTALIPDLKFSLSQRVIVLRSDEKFNHSFFTHLMGSPFIQKEYEARATGSTVKGISNYNLQEVTVIVPSLNEQRKIATILRNIDKAIRKTSRIIDTYESIRSGVIQDIATTGIGNEDLKEQKVPMLPETWEIPRNWELRNLKNMTDMITDGAHQTPTYVENGVPFLKVKDIKQEEIDWDVVARIPEEEHKKLTQRSEPTKGDVLLSKNGTIGISKVVDWDQEFSHFVSLAIIRPDQDIILPNYLATLLESQICMHQAKARSKTGTVTNLHLEEIEKLSIPVPPISDQREILEKISSVEDGLNLEKKYLNRLQKLKRGLMQDLFSGTVRTNGTNIEVPEEITQHG